MCGFAGLFVDPSSPPTESIGRLAERMAGTLVHRGPDDRGAWSDDDAGIALGFRRLSILDLSPAGHQPMRSASGRFTLVFNGEVYNESELRLELRREGFSFRGHSDTEVLLAAFERWGVRGALERFVGMFALALWDARRRELILARDRLGIKPLFVYAEDGLVTFASELKALLAGPSFDRSVSREALQAYLRHLYVPAPRTIFRHARKLLPGHVLVLREPGRPLPSSSPYWSLSEAAQRGADDPFSGTEEEAVDELERLLTEAVGCRLRSDVPLGALLSGGVDSSTVVSLMRSASTTPVKTFSIGFDASEHDEADHAARVAAHLGTEHTELDIDGRAALEVVPGIPEMFDEPHADPSQIPTHLVSKLARRHVTVAMSGDGGDELFGGYNRYIHGAPTIARAAAVPAPVRRLVGMGIERVPASGWSRLHDVISPVLPGGMKHRLPGEKAAKVGALLQEPGSPEMYVSLLSAWRDPGALLKRPTRAPDPVEEVVARSRPAGLADRMALADQRWYLPDDLLAKVDRASMAVNLEVRVPILDHRVVEFAWRLPPELKIRNGRGKWILRQVLHRHVPPALVDRPKVGFSVPVGPWLAGPLKGWAEELLSRRRLADDDLLNPDPIRSAWRAFLRGREELALGLWTVLMYQAWSDRWLG